jgi:hypothetical protein
VVGLEFLVTDFGAKMDGVSDDTLAFQKALDALPDKGVLRIPAGEAILSEVLRLKNKTIVIEGSGSGVTRLCWIRKGGLHLLETRTWRESNGEKASWEVKGINFQTRVPDGGIALFADFTSSDRLSPAIDIEGCQFTGEEGGYWTKSFHGHNAHLGRVEDCNFRGDDKTHSHIHLTGNSTCFIIDSCHGMKSQYGILVEGKTEGVTISKCYFVRNQYGFVLNIEEGGEPMFNVINSHASSGIYAIWIKNGRSSSIVGNCLILARCSNYKDGPKSREGIRIEGKLAKDIIVSSTTIQITDKEFLDTFTGIRAVSCNGLIVANNTISNNSSTDDDYGIRIERKVRQPSCSGNVFHLHSDRLILSHSSDN